MFTGAHLILYSGDADADRTFMRDVLGFANVDAGRGWLIFALPPAEMACHPSEGPPSSELYLLCDDVRATVETLAGRGVVCGAITEARWGTATAIPLPSGAKLGLYQPKHPLAITR